MRSQQDTRKRWNALFNKYTSTAQLKQDSSTTTPSSQRPCSFGIRSLCWKLFLLFPEFAPKTWSKTLRAERSAFSELRERYLVPPGGFEAPGVDPLADDESNPWKALRKDEELRKEILQDVERCMPDNPYFRDPAIQTSLLNILFVYCKLNEDVSYRQGMHEIVAVVLWVVSCDAIEGPDKQATPSPPPPPPPPPLKDFKVVSADAAEECPEDPSAFENIDYEDDEGGDEDGDDEVMKEALDARFVEHDTFCLFQIVMRSAKAWYELGEDADDNNRRRPEMRGASPIVEKSKHIHETLLMAVDPDLADNLKTLDVLPQVFLIRWIRLLFGREFPFEELLELWDSLFAEDPDLRLVDLICVAMLLRIRWQLMEADYSTALTLVLRYPSPESPNFPATFVADAIYLRDNLTPAGGRYIVSKYSHRTPAAPQPRPAKTLHLNRSKSPIGSPTRFMQPGQFESIVHDVARNMFDRSEKWGVNRAVREAVVEVRKNVQGFQAQQQQNQWNTPQDKLREEEELVRRSRELSRRLKAEEEKKKILGRMISLSIDVLERDSINSNNNSSNNEEKSLAIERLKHVRECLLDISRVPDQSLLSPSTPSSSSAILSPPISPWTKPPLPSLSRRSSTATTPTTTRPPSPPPPLSVQHSQTHHPPGPFVKTSFQNNSDPDFLTHKPRASLAQSSFAWMLGDDPAVKNKTGFVSSGLKKDGIGGVGGGGGAGGGGGGGGVGNGNGNGNVNGNGGSAESLLEDEGFDLGSLRRKR